MTVEAIESPTGPGFAFAEPSSAAAASMSQRTVSRGQAFGTDHDFLSPGRKVADRKRSGQAGDSVFDVWIGMLSLAFNGSMLVIVLGSALSAAQLASYRASAGYVFPLQAPPAPSNFAIAAGCQSGRERSCGG
jgi:hypothetical protein